MTDVSFAYGLGTEDIKVESMDAKPPAQELSDYQLRLNKRVSK